MRLYLLTVPGIIAFEQCNNLLAMQVKILDFRNYGPYFTFYVHTSCFINKYGFALYFKL